jgi:hypothetical protein
MSVPALALQPVSHPVLLSQLLPGQTRAWADDVSARVAERYLTFRRAYYNESHPRLETVPPAHAGTHQRVSWHAQGERILTGLGER